MNFGLTAEQIGYIQSTVINPLESLGAEVWCFGSRARGDFEKFSDLDLMVEGASDLSAQIGLIRETLTQSSFPYKVDLVQFQDFAESYRKSYFKERIRFSSTSIS